MELIIFDLDGTLIDSAPDLAQSINYMLKKVGRPLYDEATIRKWVGNGAQMLVKRALSGKSDPDPLNYDFFKEAMDIFLDHYEQNCTNQTKLYPEVRETLMKLERKKLAIATNKPERFVKPILEALDIDRFDIIVGGDTLPVKKPDPAMLLYIMDQLQCKDALMVGDSKNDILAAKRANIPSVAITHGYNQDEDLQSFEPDYIIHTLSQILEIVDV